VGDTLLPGEDLAGLPRGAHAVVDGPLHVASRGRLEEVVGELWQMRVGRRSVDRLQRLCHAAMQANALRARQLVVERLPDQCVTEGIVTKRKRHGASLGVGLIAHDPRLCGLVEELEERVLGKPRGLLQNADAELASDDCRQGENPVALVRELVEAPTDHLSHSLRQADPVRCL
jgi:hypothetical protein